MKVSTAFLPSQTVIWVLVANGQQAQIYSLKSTMDDSPLQGLASRFTCQEKTKHALAPVPGMVLEAESRDNYQIGHGHGGAIFGYTSSVRHTVEPHIRIQQEIKQHFAKAIVAKLDRACVEKSFDSLILVAPARMIGEIREQLTSETQKRVVGVLPKDLTHYRGQELIGHLSDTFAETHVMQF